MRDEEQDTLLVFQGRICSLRLGGRDLVFDLFGETLIVLLLELLFLLLPLDLVVLINLLELRDLLFQLRDRREQGRLL